MRINLDLNIDFQSVDFNVENARILAELTYPKWEGEEYKKQYEKLCSPIEKVVKGGKLTTELGYPFMSDHDHQTANATWELGDWNDVYHSYDVVTTFSDYTLYQAVIIQFAKAIVAMKEAWLNCMPCIHTFYDLCNARAVIDTTKGTVKFDFDS